MSSHPGATSLELEKKDPEHSGTNITYYQCHLCKNILTSLADFKGHLKDKGIYSCDHEKCIFFSGSLVDLEKHYHEVHSTFIPIICKHCNVVFSSVYDVLKHAADLCLPGVFKGPFRQP